MIKGFFYFLFSMVWFSACAQEGNMLGKARQKLSEGVPVSQLMQDPQFDSIRHEPEFRTLVRNYSRQGPLNMVMVHEPGNRIVVKGVLKNALQQPLSDHLIYVYQTDTRGWYGSDRAHFQMRESDRGHARLFCYVRTDVAGKFEIHTIQPNGYPQSDLPAHIHIEIYDSNGSALLISELLFDDDARLVGETRSRSERARFYIAKPQKTGDKKIYNYTISVDK